MKYVSNIHNVITKVCDKKKFAEHPLNISPTILGGESHLFKDEETF